MGNVHLTGYRNRVTSTVDSFIANLPEMLGAMAVDPRCFVAIIEFADVRYVQFWIEPNGDVIAEVVSNINIGDAVALSEDDEGLLRAMGWSEPSPGPNPNWRVEASGASGLLHVVAMTKGAVFGVLREKANNVATIQTWAMEGREEHSLRDLREEARVAYQDALRVLKSQLDDT